MAVSGIVVGLGVALAIGSVTAGGIVNNVVGSYNDNKGNVYGSASNTASVSLAAVAALLVTPKQTAPNPTADSAAAGTVTTRIFTLTNDSNIPDAYVVSTLTVSAGSIQSVTFTPAGAAPIAATVGTTVSPTRQPGGSITVAVAVSTVGAATGTTITVALTAKTTAPSANGVQSDAGEAWVVVARGPQIVGIEPTNAAPNNKPADVPVANLVNGVPSAQVEPGAAATFKIPFTNVGGSPALGVVVTDQIPTELLPVPGSISVQSVNRATGKSITLSAGPSVALNDHTLTATIPQLGPGILTSVVFQASPKASAQIGSTLKNPATISAQSLAGISAVPAVLFVGVMDTVFDALGGSAHPVAGALVSLLDSATSTPTRLVAGGIPVNKSNANPFATTATGLFGFGLPSTAGEAVYDLDVSASGYLNRKIKVAVQTGADGFPTTTLSALDGMPLATPGGFGLTSQPVTVADVNGFFGNVPLFPPHIVTLTVAVDRTVASAGDRLQYSVVFGPGSRALTYPADVSVALPPGVAYARGSARLASVALEPVAVGRVLSWPVKDIALSRTLMFDAVVLPSVTQGATVTTHATVALRVSGASVGFDASVDVAIVGGALSARTILSGRVFADHAGDGYFAPGDLGLAGVRIFLEDGESVQTDHDGRFSFPAARPGMHVLHLDPITLPPGMHPYHGFAVNDPRSSLQLVHGIFDSGLMSDINFAVSEGSRH